MGTFKIKFQICNNEKCKELEGLVDTGATITKIPKDVLDELGLKPVRKGKFELSDGRIIERDIGFATIKINIDGKEFVCISPVAFSEKEEEIIIGSVTLESMGLGVDPVRKKLIEVMFIEK